MKPLYSFILLFVLSACAGNSRQPANINWPADPDERSAAERFVSKASAVNFGQSPEALEFSYREIDEKRITDHFEYHIDELCAAHSMQAYRLNLLGDFVDDIRVQTCRDPDARFLLNKDFLYEVAFIVSGRGPSVKISEKMGKGFCVARELPMINQKALDERYNMVRYWPNGDRIDGRLIDKITGAFQIVVAKFEPPDLGDPTVKVSEVKAEGLMLQVNLQKKQKNNIKRSKYWPQSIKGRILAKSCTKQVSLTALTIGAVYSYQMDILFNDKRVDSTGFTVSYPDCFLYNKK